MNVEIKCVAQEGAKLPVYQTSGAAGADVCAFLDSLPEDERLFCEALLMGRVQRDIAAERNRSRITIRRKILAIRKKMIDAGLDQYLEKKSKKS